MVSKANQDVQMVLGATHFTNVGMGSNPTLGDALSKVSKYSFLIEVIPVNAEVSCIRPRSIFY